MFNERLAGMELNESLFGLRAAVADNFSPSHEEVAPYVDRLRTKEEPTVGLVTEDLIGTRMSILHATIELLKENGHLLPSTGIVLPVMTPESQITVAQRGLKRLQEQGTKLPPTSLVCIEVIRNQTIMPGLVTTTMKYGSEYDRAGRVPERLSEEALLDLTTNLDYLTGMKMVLSPIGTGWEFITGKSDQYIRATAAWREQFTGAERTEAESETEYVTAMTRFARYAKSLSKDETAFSLVDTILDELENPDDPRIRLHVSSFQMSKIPSFMDRPTALHGARFSARLYKTLYPLAEETLPH